MLEVGSISEEDKLYHFMAGLLLWAQNELRMEKVNDLASAIRVAESFLDFKGSSDGADKNKNSKGKKKFNDCEIRYYPLEQTCCALTWAAHRLRHYMLAATTFLIARMNLLKYIFEKSTLTGLA
jgi:hypothetical protein